MNSKEEIKWRCEFGVLTFAFGDKKYLRQAEALSFSLKRHMPAIKVALVTDLQPSRGVFDELVAVKAERGKGFLQKLWIDKYSPFERTLFIDSDCLVGAPFYEELDNLKRYPFTPVCEKYLVSGERDENGWVRDVGAALELCGGELLPKFNGGVYYFDRSDAAKSVFRTSRQIAARAVDFGLDRSDGKEPGDEPVFALALTTLGLLPLYDDAGRLMRTPIGIKGEIAMDEAFGSFSFEKYGKIVTPAICHFARNGIYRREYLLASSFALQGRITVGALLRATLVSRVFQVQAKLRSLARRR